MKIAGNPIPTINLPFEEGCRDFNKLKVHFQMKRHKSSYRSEEIYKSSLLLGGIYKSSLPLEGGRAWVGVKGIFR